MSAPIISADSHVFEPGDLWLRRVDRAFRDRAPRVVELPGGGEAMHYADGTNVPYGGFGSAGDRGRTSSVMPLEEVRSGGFDPAARLQDMRLDGVSAEVLYPSFGMRLFDLDDPGLQRACMRAYNDWLAEFQAAAPERLLGQALLPLDVDDAVAELERVAGRGFSGVVISGHPERGKDYATDRFEKLWRALETSRLPASLHIFTGPYSHRPDAFLSEYSVATSLVARSLTQLVFSGVFERYPGLKIVSAENDIGWVAHLMQRMDHAYERKGPRYRHGLSGELLPSELIRRQVRCTFMDDRAGLLTLEVAGPETFMWASDYPHDDSTFPESRQVIERLFGDLPPEVRHRVVYQNAADWFGLA
ncbi:MAG: amidohydrolase [Proteobacteria bacterium]|nr:amidohydrolase [Pseudomonadota bacterium]